MIRNSIRQMCRTPLKLLLFFILVSISTGLVVVGTQLYLESSRKLEKAGEIFHTIATVEQKESRMEQSASWDGALKEYSYRDYPVYEEIIPLRVLDFPEAQYIAGPEKRPYYGAYLPDYKLEADLAVSMDESFIAEFTPLEDCIPSEPVPVMIERVLDGDVFGSQGFWFCDHWTENPRPMEKGKTYIARILPQKNTHDNNETPAIEGIAYSNPACSTQKGKAGEEIESVLQENQTMLWEEVTEGFYETGRGRFWLRAIEAEKRFDKTVPVLPVTDLELLTAFHKKEASVIQGREFTAQELETGEPVCLISREFGEQNGIKPGDFITLPLYFANYGSAPSKAFYNGGGSLGMMDFSLLNAKGELYPVFWEAEYRVVGIYQYQPSGGTDLWNSEMGREEILIPAASVLASDEENIVEYGPMIQGTTSFQIPNGTMEEFQTAFLKVGKSSFLELQFDDNGYEQVKGELEKNKTMALLLLSGGLLLCMTVFLLILYFFVIKQKIRTAIECSLGMSRRQCRSSLLGGILVFTLFAVGIGNGAGALAFSQTKNEDSFQESSFSTKYSSHQSQEPSSQTVDALEEGTGNSLIWYAILPCGLFLLMLAMSWAAVEYNLKEEPMALLSARAD